MNIHHVGYVIKNIEDCIISFPYLKLKKIVKDENQNARIGLFKNLNSKVYIELIEPLNKKSYTWSFMQKGGGIHHICYFLGVPTRIAWSGFLGYRPLAG